MVGEESTRVGGRRVHQSRGGEYEGRGGRVCQRRVGDTKKTWEKVNIRTANDQLCSPHTPAVCHLCTLCVCVCVCVFFSLLCIIEGAHLKS